MGDKIKAVVNQALKLEVKMKQITKYIKKNGKILGCLTAIGYDGREEGFSLGWSKYNRNAEDKPFSKKKALEIATGRAENDSPIYVTFDAHLNIPHSFCKDIDEFIERCQRYFKTHFPPHNLK